MDYYIRYDGFGGNHLAHSSGPWEEHSYTLRTGTKNNYSYTYPKAIIQRYNENRKRADAAKAAKSKKKSGTTESTSSSKSSKKTTGKEKFFRYMGGNFNKYFQQNYQQSKDKREQSLYSSAGQADALMKQINEGRSKNVEADLIAIRHHLDEINTNGSDKDKEGAARMASEFMHDIQEGDPDNAKKYSKILGTGTYDLSADEKNAKGETETKKKSAKKKSTKKKSSKKTTAQHSAFDPLDYKYSIGYKDEW